MSSSSVAPHGRLLRRLGWAMFLVGLIVGVGLRFVEHLTWFDILPALLVIGGASILYRGKQLAAAARSRAANELVENPVVYLRPFAADESGLKQIFSALLTAKMFTPVLSEEEQLSDAVAPIGPLVAIGEPGEVLPKPGAARVYPARWRETVDDLLRRARLVILRPGRSAGVLWEVEETFKTVNPERIVLLLRGMKSGDYEQLRSTLAETCAIELPPFRDVRSGRKVHAFIEFGPDGTPRALPLKAPYWRGSVRHPRRDIFKYALHPVFQRLGAPWQPSPVSWGKVVAIGTLGLMPTLLVVALLLSWFFNGRPDVHDRDLADVAPAPTTTTAAPEPQPQLIAGLQIAVSGKPEAVEARLDAGTRQKIDAMESVVCRDDPMQVIVSRIDYKEGIVVNLDGAAKGALDKMATSEGIADFQAQTAESAVSGLRAIRSTVSFTISGQKWVGHGVVVAAGQSLWNVVAVAPTSDSEAAVRVIDSIVIPQARGR